MLAFNIDIIFNHTMANLISLGFFLAIFALIWGFNRDFFYNRLGRKGTLWSVVIISIGVTLATNAYYNFELITQKYFYYLLVSMILGVYVSKLSYLLMMVFLYTWSLIQGFSFEDYQVYIFAVGFITLFLSIDEDRKRPRFQVSLAATLFSLFIIQILTLGVDSLITVTVQVAFVSIVALIAMVFSNMIDKIYTNAHKLRSIIQFETGTVIRKALTKDVLEAFVFENKIKYAIVCAFSFKEIAFIRKRHGSHHLETLINKIMKSIDKILSQKEKKLFKIDEDTYGILIPIDTEIESLNLEMNGNKKDKRDKNDILTIVETTLKQLTTHFIIDGRWVTISTIGGASILGVHSNDVNELIRFSDFTLKTRNEMIDVNEVILFDYKKMKTYSKEKSEIRKMKTFVNIHDITSGFVPVVDTKDGRLIGYRGMSLLRGSSFLTINDLFKKARLANLDISLSRLMAQQTVKIYGKKEKFPLFIHYDARVFSGEFNPYAFISKVEKFGSLPRLIVLTLDAKFGFYEDENLLKSISILKSAGIKILINNIDEAGKAAIPFLEKLKPEYASFSRELISILAKDSNAKDVVKLYSTYCKKSKIKLIATNVATSGQLKALKQFGITIISGPLIGKPKPIPSINNWITNLNIQISKD